MYLEILIERVVSHIGCSQQTCDSYGPVRPKEWTRLSVAGSQHRPANAHPNDLKHESLGWAGAAKPSLSPIL